MTMRAVSDRAGALNGTPTPEQLKAMADAHQALLAGASRIVGAELKGMAMAMPAVELHLQGRFDIQPQKVLVAFGELEVLVCQMRLALLEMQGISSSGRVNPGHTAAPRAAHGSGH